jgi:branched-chain amino acid transport system ATP-binding protein
VTNDLLAVEDLSARYGRLTVVHGTSFTVPEGQVTCLVGANGAGKTTTLRAIAGQHRSFTGRICFDGADIQGLRAYKIARRRVAHVPEGRRVFASLTTTQNLRMGGYAVRGGWKSAEDLDHVFTMFPELVAVRDKAAGLLSGGQQQMLAIGRALMSKPRLLILDEPSMGLAPLLVERIFDALAALKAAGTTILLAEQNARLALRLCDWAYILELGHVVEHGSAAELSGSARMEEIYLGG